MKKNLIAIAVAGAMSVPLSAQAADMMSDAKVSGFVDTFLSLSNDHPSCTVATFEACEGQFDVYEAEIDVEAMGVRIDVDRIAGGSKLEQANFTTDLGGWGLTVGRFNSGLSADAQDAPDMNFSTNSLVFGNYAAANLVNVDGAAVSGMAGPAKVMLAVVNDPTINPTGAAPAASAGDVANAFVIAVSGSVMDGLDVGVSMVSADADDLTDLTVDYKLEALTVGLDYFTSDATDTYSIMAGYDMGNGFGVKVRLDNDAPDVGNETDTTTIHLDYALTDNVALALENYASDDGTIDYSATTLEFIASF